MLKQILKIVLKRFKQVSMKLETNQGQSENLFLLGYTTVFDTFGLTFLGPVLIAVANDIDIPNNATTPNARQSVLLTDDQLMRGLSSATATVSALTISSCSFIFRVGFSLILAVAILKARGK